MATEFYFSASLGGVTYVKVKAKDLDTALQAAAHLVIDDWENAGPLKIGDIQLETLDIDDEGRLLDGSVIMADEVDRSIVVRKKARPEEYVELELE